MSDWYRHNMLLHDHSNHKFAKLTRRTEHDDPVFQRFDDATDNIDCLIVAFCAICLIGIVAALVLGFL